MLQLTLPLYSLQVFDRVLLTGSLPTLVALSGLATFLLLASSVIEASRAAVLSRAAHAFDLAIYHENRSKISEGNHATLETLRESDVVRTILSSSMASALMDLPWSAAFACAMFYIHFYLGVVTLAAMTVVAVTGLVSYFVSWNYRTQQLLALREASSAFDPIHRERSTILALGLGEAVAEKVISARQRALAKSSKVSDTQIWCEAVARGLRGVLQIVLISITATLVLSTDVPVGSVVAGSMLFSRAISPFERVASAPQAVASLFQALLRLAKRPRSPQTAEANTWCPALLGEVSATKLTYRGAGRLEPSLCEVDLEAKPGTLTVITGPTGAGKSTLAKLLVGALCPDDGEVRIDGYNIAGLSRSALGAQIGFLAEDGQTGSGKVAQIIARGEFTFEMDDVVAAARFAGVHAAIQALPYGYDTELTYDRHQLSAGEKQRIALARAFYRRPRVIVLDEPTSNLDDEGEATLLRAIQDLLANGSTVIVVTRLSRLVSMADRVVLLKGGTLALHIDQRTGKAWAVPQRLAS